MPFDIQLGLATTPNEYTCEAAYTEWLRSTLREAHAKARKTLATSALRQTRNYRETTQDLQFRRGDWVWREYPRLGPGKLLHRNVGPWLVLARMDDTNYRIQRDAEADSTVVHVDRLSRYFPDFGVTLTPWIDMTEVKPTTHSTQTDPPVVSDKTGDCCSDTLVDIGSSGSLSAGLTPRSLVYPLALDPTHLEPVIAEQVAPAPVQGAGLDNKPVKRKAGRPAKAKAPLPVVPEDRSTSVPETQTADPAVGHTKKTPQVPTTPPVTRQRAPKKSKAAVAAKKVAIHATPPGVSAHPKRAVRRPDRYCTT